VAFGSNNPIKKCRIWLGTFSGFRFLVMNGPKQKRPGEPGRLIFRWAGKGPKTQS
jgi:hypothetical protein